MKNWMALLTHVLKLNSQTKDEKLNIVIFECKGEALRTVVLYAVKYRDEFQDLLKKFSQEIWQLC